MTSAYLLITHGSRDPRSQTAAGKLAQLVHQQLQASARPSCDSSPTAVMVTTHPLVGTAALELAPAPLHKSIEQFVQQAQSRGFNQVKILPLFLLPGVHVREDIPAEIAQAQQAVGVKLELCPYLGSQSGLLDILAKQIDSSIAGRILLSHGSRRPNSKVAVEKLASKLGAVAAYWSVAPSIEHQVKELAAAGHREIAIFPYFLFAGGITEAIAQHIYALQQDMPNVKLHLGQPLGATAELAKLIVEMAT